MSKQFVKDHMPVGSSQTLVTIKDATGKFGRILGKFKLNNNKILNEVMIEQNYAVAYHGQSKDDIQEEHLKNRKILDERINES